MADTNNDALAIKILTTLYTIAAEQNGMELVSLEITKKEGERVG